MLFGADVPGNVIGLAITQALTMTSLLQWGVRHSAEASNQMMAIERILEYRNLEPEPQSEKICETTTEWPSEGKIEFSNVVYRYDTEAQPALRGVSLVIEPKEKIGIVGRTGAGECNQLIELPDFRKFFTILRQELIDRSHFSIGLRRRQNPDRWC